ncbi:MAG: hypothetical protein JWQ87_2239 [Candidatus Sulfotelmatobacter sp.]|nr:hypothetical protein [Candidatus Sulfotelmatobacter sp.]
MRITFEINNVSDPANGLPSACRFVEMRGITGKDLELPIEEFVIRFVSPLVQRCRKEFLALTTADPFPTGSVLPSSADVADLTPETPPK